MENQGEFIVKTYAVVKFLIDSLYSEVPISWLTREDNNQLCYWPPRKINAKVLIANYTSPNVETWNLYEVEVIKYCSKYLWIHILSIYALLLYYTIIRSYKLKLNILLLLLLLVLLSLTHTPTHRLM